MEGLAAHVVYVERTASTNDDAAQVLDDDAALGMTIVAEEQTRGAGRKGRPWIAAPGSALLFTTILPRELSAKSVWCVPFWTALAVREALARHGVDAALHWPNDLLLGEKKLAGILCISRVLGDSARVGCGVGINVHRLPGAEAGIVPAPAFCDDVAHVDRQALLTTILQRFAASLSLLDDARAVARRWESAAGLPGRRYRLQLDEGGEPFDATAVGLASGGALVIERDGERREIALADARALR